MKIDRFYTWLASLPVGKRILAIIGIVALVTAGLYVAIPLTLKALQFAWLLFFYNCFPWILAFFVVYGIANRISKPLGERWMAFGKWILKSLCDFLAACLGHKAKKDKKKKDEDKDDE